MTTRTSDVARVLVVDDHPRRRETLVSRINGNPQIELVGQLGTVSQVVEDHRDDATLVVILCMADTSAAKLRECQNLREKVKGARPVVLIDQPSDAAVLGVFASGAVGLLLCTAPARLLQDAIVAAGNGGVFVDPMAGRKLVELALHHYRLKGVFGLTPQELRVLRSVARGKSNAEVGRDLGISPHTVKSHVRQILKKLGASDRHEATETARRHGLV